MLLGHHTCELALTRLASRDKRASFARRRQKGAAAAPKRTLGSGLQAVEKHGAVASKLKPYPSVFITGGLRWKVLHSTELTDALRRRRMRYSMTTH